jgi:hypothetical protein
VNKPTFYEQVGIVIPGAVLLFGLLQFFPALRTLFGADGVSLGELGIFFLLAYAAGHLVAAVGNVGENIGWRISGGMPSDWVIKTSTNLISPQQLELLDARVRSRLAIDVLSVRGLAQKVWRPISRQLYADVMRNGKPDRIDTFNGNYGLNRGLAASTLLLAGVAASKAHWAVGSVLIAASAIYGYRAYRFGVHYARELYVQFLALNA